MVLALAVIAILILLNALYVAAEFAAVGVRRSRLRRLCEDGNPLAARILPIVEDPHALDRYIAACQIGITISSLVLGAYAQATLAPRIVPLLTAAGLTDAAAAASTAAVAVLLSLTVLQMVLGELVPKSLALQHPTRAALVTVLPMQWSLPVFAWFIAILNGSGLLVLRALGVPTTGHRHVHSPEEIELLIAESRDGGLLEPEEQVRLNRALRLGRRTARELMVPRARLSGIEVSTPFDTVLEIVEASPYSRLPVYRGSLDDVIGMLHTKDVVMDFVSGTTGRSIAGLVRPIVRISDTMPADRLLAFLRERRSHQALVIDGDAHVAGLITVEDVVAELLGGVSDEFKSPMLRVLRLPDGRIRLPGALRVEQAAAIVGADWRAPGQTVGAYITAVAGPGLEQGERIAVQGAEVEIEAVEDGIATSIIATTPSEERR